MESRIRRSTGTQVVTGAGPGRPPGTPGSQRTTRLVVRVTEAERDAYQAAADRAGVPLSEWVRGRLALLPLPMPDECSSCGYKPCMCDQQ